MTTTETPPSSDSTSTGETISVSRLRAEITGETHDSSAETIIADVVAEVEEALFDGDTFTFQESHVKSSLDELLLSIVGLRSAETHGKQLLDDLAQEFNTVLSPGTVYPRLHDLCDDSILEQRELVKTKEYAVDDPDAARSTVADAASQHLALGLVLHAAIDRGAFD